MATPSTDKFLLVFIFLDGKLFYFHKCWLIFFASYYSFDFQLFRFKYFSFTLAVFENDYFGPTSYWYIELSSFHYQTDV